MKRIIIISIFVFASISLRGQNQSNAILQRLDQLKFYIDVLNSQPKDVNKDSLFISIEHFEKLAQLLNKNNNIWNDILPSLIAILVVIISTLGALFIGVRQIRAQTKNAEEQIRSQEAQAQDQLCVTREQIQATSKMTLAQVRANNISQARITWIQELRALLSQFNGEIAVLNYHFRSMQILLEKGLIGDEKKIYIEQLERIKKSKVYAFKIKLFLNKNEINHIQLEGLINKYIETGLEDYSSLGDDLNKISSSILEISRTILKDAWEQAKNEGSN